MTLSYADFLQKSPDAAAERKEKPKISIANLATVSSHYTKRVTTVGGGSGEYLSKTKYRFAVFLNLSVECFTLYS